LNLHFSAEDIAFRAQARDWLHEHVPRERRPHAGPAARAFDLSWQALQYKAGWAGISWPEEYGGLGLSLTRQLIWHEEYARANAPDHHLCFVALNHAGPTLMAKGSEAQKQYHLPRILKGEVIWCQGFSEPEAGSDLASLRTKAIPAPNEHAWRVHGQKIWTSYALMAQWCFLLARTSVEARKQQGLTVFLVPMSAPGIEVRPIKAMLGPHHLNEVFLDDVRVTPDDVLGQVGAGWEVVQEVLAFERVGIARYARCERLLLAAPRVLDGQWEELPEELRGRWARMLTHCRRARLLAYQVVARQSAGTVTPGDAAAYRIAVTRLDQDSAEVLMEILGLAALAADGDGQWFRGEVTDHWRYAQASTVASGSIEMQRILLARGLLR
jgi:alkylation response protein AidB-like acyl-CoA dehydrogenase